MADCIITGVALINPEEGVFAADLFQQGRVFIINANEKPMPPEYAGDKTVTLTGNYWMRRGVYVVNIEDVELSPAANNYIGN
jgi:hypothetical protein